MSVSFQEMGAFASDAVNLVGGGEPRRLAIAPVTPEVLPLLGVRPALGRVFQADGKEDENSVILSHGLWQSQFGGDREVVGRSVTLNGTPCTIVGVLPPAFRFPYRDVQLWTLLTFRPDDFSNRNNRYLEAVARLNPGVSFEQAQAELWSLAGRLARDYPDTNAEAGVR